MNKSTSCVQNNEIVTEKTGLARLLRLWQGTCVRYTVLSLCMLVINLCLSGDEQAYVEPLRFLLFLPFAFFLTLATVVRRTDRLRTGTRVLLHPACVLGGFYLCLYLPYQLRTKPTGAQALTVILLVAVVYGLAMGIIYLCTRSARQKEIDSAPYESQFGRK